MPVLKVSELINERVGAILKYHEVTGFRRAEVDVSGGIDSAVVLALVAAALGPENVTAVFSAINSSSQSHNRARLVAAQYAVKLAKVDATGPYNVLVDACRQALMAAGYDMAEIDDRCKADPSIMGSLRSTLRAPMGRFMNRLTGGGIRHGTGNEDEDRWLRFYQKGGDGEVDTNPLAMLSKGEVYQLAVGLQVPREIVEAIPTPDLWGIGDAHNDEDELARISGVEWTYSRVDPETGKYLCVGTIERLSRFLDHRFSAWFDSMCLINGSWLFAAEKGYDGISGDWVLNMDALVEEAKRFFPGRSDDEVRAFLTSARKIERATRHKMNPNCPTLGPGWWKRLSDGGGMRKTDREVFVEEGILTNNLPEM